MVSSYLNCYLPLAQVPGNPIHQGYYIHGQMGRNHLMFLHLLEFEPKTSRFSTHFIDYKATPMGCVINPYIRVL